MLEENHAIVPRVIIDSKIVYELKLDSSDELIRNINNQSDSYLFVWNWSNNQTIKIEKDIPLFINYFSNIENDEALKEIMNNIQESIYSEVGLYKKFKWVADYLVSYLHYRQYQDASIIKDQGYIRLLDTL